MWFVVVVVVRDGGRFATRWAGSLGVWHVTGTFEAESGLGLEDRGPPSNMKATGLDPK
jgi:hypothetical protein